MEFHIQYGWGMKAHSVELVKKWGSGTVILSPRDLEPEELEDVSKRIQTVNGSSVLDPQFYLPRSDHTRLTSHDYWPQNYGTSQFWQGDGLRNLITALMQNCEKIGSNDIILPGLFTSEIDDIWLGIQRATISTANQLIKGQLNTFATVAVSSDIIKDNSQIHKLLDELTGWAVDGIYLLFQHPKDEYFVDDPIWLANILDLICGVRLQNKKAYVGYCNQQMLILSCAPVNAIAAGIWMNLRSFSTDKFRASPESEPRNRAVWYYHPDSLSEYKLPYLDIAQRMGVLTSLFPQPTFDNSYSSKLFSAPQPSLSGYKERDAFRHYLHTLRQQVTHLSPKTTFIETCDNYLYTLDEAESALSTLEANGIKGETRGFGKVLDACRSAITTHKAIRGPVLSRKWRGLFN